MKIGERIRAERRRLKMSQDEVAVALETTKQAIYKYEKGIVENIPPEKVERMATLFGVTPAYLIGWSEEKDDETENGEQSRQDLPDSLRSELRPISVVRLPVLGNVACGEPIYAAEERETCVCAGGVNADFCLTAHGDSMINARIFDGDLLFVKQQEIVDDGEIAVVLIEDEATVKRVFYDRESDILTLMPENPLYRPMRFQGAQLDQIRILGRVVAVQYEVR
jgi:repressor LexA